MQTSLEDDLHRLSEFAFGRSDWSEGAARDFHRLRKTAGRHPDFPLMEGVYAWLFAPFTSWAIDFQGVFEVILQRIKEGKRLEPELRLLIDTLPPLPGEKARAVAAAHERDIERGDYDAQVKAAEKYRLREEMLLRNRQFRDGWAAIKARFAVAKYQDRQGIIRRRMVSERGFRPDWGLRWKERAGRFQAVFDVFCQRWNLYGMKGDEPLLQKLTVNLTPHGTMVFIPSWWSLDSKRDLNWSEIKRLHKTRAPAKQGAKLTRNQMEQAAEAEKAATFDAQARGKGLKGERRASWVMQKLKWPIQDPRKLRLVLSRARRLEVKAQASILA